MRRLPAACTYFPAVASTATIICTFTTRCGADPTMRKRRNSTRSAPSGAASGSPASARASKRPACCSRTIATARCSTCTTTDLEQRFDDYRHALHRGELSLERDLRARESDAGDRPHALPESLDHAGRAAAPLRYPLLHRRSAGEATWAARRIRNGRLGVDQPGAMRSRATTAAISV